MPLKSKPPGGVGSTVPPNSGMALTPEQESLLFEYVQNGQHNRKTNGIKIDALSQEIRQQNNATQLNFQKYEHTNREFRTLLNGHAKRISDLEEIGETTSKHDLTELRQKIKDREIKDAESSTWLKRWGIQTFAAISLLIASAAVGYLARLPATNTNVPQQLR